MSLCALSITCAARNRVRVVFGLRNCRLGTICGDEGVGKSATAIAVSHYLAVRRHFPGGIIYVKVQVGGLAWLVGHQMLVSSCRVPFLPLE